MPALLFYFQDEQLFIFFLMKLCSRIIEHIQFCCLTQEYLLLKNYRTVLNICGLQISSIFFFLCMHVLQNMWDLTPDTDLLAELPAQYTFEASLADLIVSYLDGSFRDILIYGLIIYRLLFTRIIHCKHCGLTVLDEED